MPLNKETDMIETNTKSATTVENILQCKMTFLSRVGPQ